MKKLENYVKVVIGKRDIVVFRRIKVINKD